MKPITRDVPLDDYPTRESTAIVAPCGFREYDARWRYPEEINLLGVQTLGMGLGALLREFALEREEDAPVRIVVGRDFRSYSPAVAQALCLGLVTSGMEVLDIGLALSPTAYFACDNLQVPAAAMVTASHNENGWTGFKIGGRMPLTFGTDEMARLRDIVLSGRCFPFQGGSYRRIEGFRERYIADLSARPGFTRSIRLVVACGNGTAGIFAPDLLRRLGVRVIAMDCDLDPSFPRYEPNPEHLTMLEALRERVLHEDADFGLGFDGDGDRCGFVDGRGRILFADKVGLLLARFLATRNSEALFVVDSKTTGIFARDKTLKESGARVEYWKTGHSHIKARMAETGALAAFEKSGHFYFAKPVGRGYDDALLGAVLLCELLCRENRRLEDLYDDLETSYVSPTIGAYCPDRSKHEVVDTLAKEYEGLMREGSLIANRKISDVLRMDGLRFVLEDSSWGLVRASSNKPSLVIVVESLVSKSDMELIFEDIDGRLRGFTEIGKYDQCIANSASGGQRSGADDL